MSGAGAINPLGDSMRTVLCLLAFLPLGCVPIVYRDAHGAAYIEQMNEAFERSDAREQAALDEEARHEQAMKQQPVELIHTIPNVEFPAQALLWHSR